MPHAQPVPHWPDADLEDWEVAAEEEAWALAALDGDCVPSLADRFRITDLQHWLDLCA